MSIWTGGWARQVAISSTRCWRSGSFGSVAFSRANVSRRKSAPDVEALGPVRGDHLVDGGREVGTTLPVGEQVHILARALENAVRRDRVPTGQGEPERPAA